jgi:hypothetical protein
MESVRKTVDLDAIKAHFTAIPQSLRKLEILACN